MVLPRNDRKTCPECGSTDIDEGEDGEWDDCNDCGFNLYGNEWKEDGDGKF